MEQFYVCKNDPNSIFSSSNKPKKKFLFIRNIKERKKDEFGDVILEGDVRRER
jgi:hypothetical protein